MVASATSAEAQKRPSWGLVHVYHREVTAPSKSEERSAIDDDRDGTRPSGDHPRTGEHRTATFDDVTPTRPSVIGLADMDEDLPTRNVPIAELALIRSAAASDTPSGALAPAGALSGRAPTRTPDSSRRDAIRPRTEAVAPEPVAFRSFPSPRERDSVPSLPPTPNLPREVNVSAIEPQTEDTRERSIAPEPIPTPSPRGPRVLVAISCGLLILAAVALAIERMGP